MVFWILDGLTRRFDWFFSKELAWILDSVFLDIGALSSINQQYKHRD